MSVECKKQIRRRQKMMSEDYKVSLSLAKACKVIKKKFLENFTKTCLTGSPVKIISDDI